MFRRKGKGDPVDDGSDAADASAGPPEVSGEPLEPLASSAAGGLADAADAAIGPYDVSEAPSDDIPRIDLGSLRVPIVDGLEVRLDMDEATGEPSQLVLADGDSMMQLGVFAAPKSRGIWPEIRAEIAESLKGTGGSADEIIGPLGAELSASVPTGDPGVPFAPARFIGVDRPRWFLRGLLSGPAAIDGAAAERLEFALRATVVVRGQDAMPIRDPLPLRLPPEAAQLAQEQLQAQAEAEGAPTLDHLEPGPTITETR